MFVGGLKEGTTEDEIKERFENYGTIEKIELIKDKATGKQRGFCFVTYNDPDAVDKCVCKFSFFVCLHLFLFIQLSKLLYMFIFCILFSSEKTCSVEWESG